LSKLASGEPPPGKTRPPSNLQANDKWSDVFYPIGFVKRTKKDVMIRNYTPDLKVILANENKANAASIKAKYLIASGQFNKDQTDWLTQIIMVSEILETDRYDYFEADVKSLNHDWLKMKPKENLNGLLATEFPADE